MKISTILLEGDAGSGKTQFAKAKTDYHSENILSLLAETIILLDETARANAIKGVAGMRSYIFWVDAAASGASIQRTVDCCQGDGGLTKNA